MNYHGFAPLISFPTGRPLAVRFPSHMRLLADTLRCLPQVLSTPYDADADLAADEQTIIVTDSIDVVLSEPLARTNVRFILIGSEKQHLERLLPDRVLVLAASQLEAIRYLVRQLEVGDWALLVNRLYDSTFKQRCRQLAPAYGATLIQEFSNQSEIEKIIQKNSLQRVIAVSPYESIPPLAGRVREVLYTGVSQLTEKLFLEQIFLKKGIEVAPDVPMSATQNQPELLEGSQKDLSSSRGQQKETSLSSSGAFPKPIFLPMVNVEPEVAVCWMPPPVTSISQAPSPPKFKVIDLDPLSCMRLQMYCSSNGHNFARADSYRDLYRCLVDSEPTERILIIASKENFQLVRDLNETVQKAKIVMLYNRQSYLSEAETAFKQEMKVAVLIADKNHLADILANTPGMIFPDLIPSSSVSTNQLVESKGFRRIDTGPNMQSQAMGSNSVSLVETFDMDNPRKRPIIESELAIASDKEGSDDGLVVNAFPIIRDILQQRNPFGSGVQVSSVNSSNFPESMSQPPNISYGDVIRESSEMRSDGGSSLLRKELVVEAPKPEFSIPQETIPEERDPKIGSGGPQQAIKCTIFPTGTNVVDQLPIAELKPSDTNIDAGEQGSQIPEVIKCTFPEVSPREEKSDVGSNPHPQYLMNGEEAATLPAEIFQGQPISQPMESLSHSKSDNVELPGLDGFQKKGSAYEAVTFDPPKEVEPVRQLEMEPLIGQTQQGAELPPLLTPSGSQLGPATIPFEGLAEPVFFERPLKLEGPVEPLPEASPQHLESGVAEGHTAPEIQPVADRSYADSEAVPKMDQRLMVLAEQLPRDEPAAVLLPTTYPQPRISDLIQTHGFNVPEPYTAVPYNAIPQPAPAEQKANIEQATQHTIEPSNRLESEPSIELAVSPLAQSPVVPLEQNIDRLMSARSSQHPSQLAVDPQAPIELENKQLYEVAPIQNVPALPASQLMQAAATEIKSTGRVDYSRKESKQSGREGLISSQHKQASVKGSQPKEVSAKGSQYKEASVRSGQKKQASVKDSRPLQLEVRGSQYKEASAKGAYLKKPSINPSEKGPKLESAEPILVKQPSQRSLKKDPLERGVKKEPSERSIKKEPAYLGESVETLPKSTTSLQNLVAQEYMSTPPIQSEPLISGDSYRPPENAEPTTPKMYGKTLQQIGSLRKIPSQNAQQATPPAIYSQTMAKAYPSAPVIPLPSTPMQNSVPSSIFNDSTPTRIYSFNRSIQPTLILLHKDLTSQPFIEKVDHMVFESLGELLFIMNKESKVPGAKIEVKTIHAPEYHSIPSMPNVRIIRYVVGYSSSLERTRVKTPLFRRKGSLSRDREDQVNMKKVSSNPAAEYQTIARQDLNSQLKKSFVKRMFNKELVYILVEDRKMSLVARIEGVKHFNTRLRLETYNRNNILQIAMGLVHDHSLVIVASEEDTMEQARSFLMAYNVPLLYCGPNAGQLMPPPESNIYPMTNKRQVIEMIASIPRFFSAASTTKTAVKSVLDHQVIHLYFQSAVTEAYKREIIELAEQQRRKIVPHEIQNHHQIQCLTENMKEEMFVCIVKSQSMYESLLEKPAPNLLVYWTQTERDGLGKLFASLRTLISRKQVQKRQSRITSTGNAQQNEYGYGPDLNKRLINVEFKKLLKSENSSGISNRSGTEQLDQQLPQQQPPPQLQPPMEPIPNSNILEKFHPPKYIISRLESIADTYGNINVLIERSNTQLKDMLMGMPGVTSQDYQNIQGMRSIFELYRTTASFPLLVVVTDRDTLRHVYDLKRLYPNTEYAAVLNMVDAESEISENYKRFRKPKLPEYLKDVFFAVQSNRRLAILLAARAEIVRKRLVVRSVPSPISLSSNYARLCIFHKQPKDEFIVNSLRDRILRPILSSCMFFGYQSSRDISESLETLDHLGEHMLCIVLERDEEIPDVQDHLSKSYRNLHVRFIRVFSKGFKGYASLKDNPNILTEDDNETNILRFVDDFLIGGNSSTGSIPPNSRSTAQPIELISSQESILQSDEVVKLAKAPSAKFEEVAAAAKPEVPSPTKDSLIIDFDHSSMKQPVKEEKPEAAPLDIDNNPYSLPMPETMRQSSSHQKDETELKSSAKVGAGIQTSQKSSSKKALPISNIPSSKIRRAASVRDLLKKKSIGEQQPPSVDSSQLVPSIHSVMPLKKPTSFLHQVVSMAPRKSRPRSAKSRAHSQC